MARRRHRRGLGQRDLVGRHLAGRGETIEHTVARGARHRGRAIRPALLRRLRQRDEERGFAKRKMARFLAEISERRGANALDIAAIGRNLEIEREHLVLVQHALDLDRAHDLAKLRRKGAFAGAARAGAPPAW